MSISTFTAIQSNIFLPSCRHGGADLICGPVRHHTAIESRSLDAYHPNIRNPEDPLADRSPQIKPRQSLSRTRATPNLHTAPALSSWLEFVENVPPAAELSVHGFTGLECMGRGKTGSELGPLVVPGDGGPVGEGGLTPGPPHLRGTVWPLPLSRGECERQR